MIRMIIFMFKRMFLVFHDLIISYDNFMMLIQQEKKLSRDKMKYQIIYNLKCINYIKIFMKA